MDSEEYHQLMLERLQALTEAIERAERGQATPQDWTRIRFECGLERKNHVRDSAKAIQFQTSTPW